MAETHKEGGSQRKEILHVSGLQNFGEARRALHHGTLHEFRDSHDASLLEAPIALDNEGRRHAVPAVPVISLEAFYFLFNFL